ncbi:16285_t:CDS:2 [Cetraspora pellucida]|uniref:16285_t:CDS:1 n=1 Tax=Cetraspora pellucida TaxID=1433469 RepID=A0A9N8Z3M1_9GLOM|nr:16285_t:CDS:2 [Cetraspora pellucida]
MRITTKQQHVTKRSKQESYAANPANKEENLYLQDNIPITNWADLQKMI